MKTFYLDYLEVGSLAKNGSKPNDGEARSSKIYPDLSVIAQAVSDV
jgi:hypothetical protein